MMALHPDAVAIAADVAARYGAIVRPDVVRRVPAGLSSLPLPVWNGRDLVYPDGTPNRWQQATNQHYIRKARQPKPHIAERREQLRRLHAQGLIDCQIAGLLGVSVQVVYDDRTRMGLPNNLPVLRAQGNPKHLRIAELARAGVALEDIAADLGLIVKHVQQIAREKFGLALRKKTRAQRHSEWTASPAAQRVAA